MSDLISRQAAIDAIQKEINKGIPPFDDVMGSIRCGIRLARNIIEDLPSAQPKIEERKEESAQNVLKEDLISRKAAIKAIHEDADWLAAQGSDWQTERMERDKSILKSLPSAQPERKTGKWGEHGECPFCGYLRQWEDDKYCGNCGADMRGEQDE